MKAIVELLPARGARSPRPHRRGAGRHLPARLQGRPRTREQTRRPGTDWTSAPSDFAADNSVTARTLSATKSGAGILRQKFGVIDGIGCRRNQAVRSLVVREADQVDGGHEASFGVEQLDAPGFLAGRHLPHRYVLGHPGRAAPARRGRTTRRRRT